MDGPDSWYPNLCHPTVTAQCHDSVTRTPFGEITVDVPDFPDSRWIRFDIPAVAQYSWRFPDGLPAGNNAILYFGECGSLIPIASFGPSVAPLTLPTGAEFTLHVEMRSTGTGYTRRLRYGAGVV